MGIFLTPCIAYFGCHFSRGLGRKTVLLNENEKTIVGSDLDIHIFFFQNAVLGEISLVWYINQFFIHIF